MTEQVLAEPNLQNQAASPAPTQNTPNVSHETPVKKVFTQDELNEIVGRNKADAESKGYERAKRELSMQTQAQSAPINQQQSMGGMQQQSPHDIEQLIDQRLEQKSQVLAANQFVNQFIQKMDVGKTKYPDFEQSVGKFNFANIADIVQLASATDNTADVMYDLSKNPQNLIKLRELNQVSPQLAFDEMQRLSASIKQNEAAAQQKTANEPLGQVKPSTTGTDNGSLNGVRDYKKQPWLRA